MRLTHELRSGVIQIISPEGRIDHQYADTFLQQIEPFVAGCGATCMLVLNLEQVDFISSTGLRALLMTAKRISAQGGNLVIVGLQPMVREVFEISRFNLLFKICATIDAAVREHEMRLPELAGSPP